MNISPATRLLAACLMSVSVACAGSPQAPTRPSASHAIQPAETPSPPPGENRPPSTPPFVGTGQTARVVAVGDIGMCSERAAVERTAALVDRLEGRLLLAGDLAYMRGTFDNFRDCFDPAWGRFRQRWQPVPGNHEYETGAADGFRQYFGDTLGPGGRTYYSFRTGDWLVLMIDSSEPARAGSPQYEMARTALQTTTAPCTLAVWHHPLFSSGPNGPNNFMRDLWRLLYEHHGDVVISAHDHLYERFGKQDVDGRSDGRGLRQFIVGTGGARLYDFHRQEPNSQARVRAHGVLQLTLAPTSYQWAFIDTTGATLDAGADTCH